MAVAPDPLQVAWALFAEEIVSALDGAQAMGMEAKNVANCYRALVEAKLAIDNAMKAVNAVTEEMQQWKNDGEWEIRMNRLHAAKLGLIKPGSMS